MTELPQSFQPISAGASADQVSVHLMSLISPPPASPLPKSWEIPDAIRNRLGREAGPQRAMLEEGHLLVIAHRMPGPDERVRVPVFFHRSPQGAWRGSDSKAQGPTGQAQAVGFQQLALGGLHAVADEHAGAGGEAEREGGKDEEAFHNGG